MISYWEDKIGVLGSDGATQLGTEEESNLLTKADLCFSTEMAICVFTYEKMNVLQTTVWQSLTDSVGVVL